nr:hypothetical protein [Tanacetum cinerariifolium]
MPYECETGNNCEAKEETFQVVMNSTYFKAFTISDDVPEIHMQQFWHTITKVKGSDSYEFLLANKECVVNTEVFRKILNIYPRNESEDFTKVPNDYDTLTFLVGLGYSSPLHKYTNMFVDHMHQPWRTLAACINKCLSGKTAIEQYGLPILATMLNIDKIKLESYQRFLLYSTGSISPKKSIGKGSQRKKTGDTTKETVEVNKKSDPEPFIRKKTSRRSVTKKEATISAASNIILDPDLALELGKSISLTEAEEEAAARQTADIMKALKESKKTSRRQSGTGGLVEGTGEITEVLDESIVSFTTSSEGTGTNTGYKIKVRKDVDVEMKDAETVKEKEELKDAEKTAELTKEITEQPLTSPSLSVSSNYGTQFLNLSQDEETSEKPPVTSTTSEVQQTTPILTTIPTPPINTEAPSILKSLGSSHTADLIEKYSRLPALESSKKQESKKSAEEIIRIKREQDEKNQMATYTIKSTDKAALKEFDLKSALFKAMHENESANRNPSNYRFYHALMKTLIEDENSMD